MSAQQSMSADAQSKNDTDNDNGNGSSELQATAESVAKQFAAATDADIDVDACAAQLVTDARQAADAYSINDREALRSVANTLFDAKHDVSREDYSLSQSSQPSADDDQPIPADPEAGDVISLAELGDLDVGEDEEVWPDADLVANVVYLNDDHPEWLAQVGLLSDGSADDDAINFNLYGSSAAKHDFGLEGFEPIAGFDPDGNQDAYEFLDTDRDDAAGLPLQVGDTVRVRDYVVESYNGDNSVYFNGATSMRKLDEDLDTREEAIVTGPISEIKAGSGFIERCSHENCSRVLSDGRCYEHDQVDGEDDLRIKAVVEANGTAVDVVFNRELTADLTGIDLEAAERIATDAVDREAVREEMRSDDGILGETVTVSGVIYEDGGAVIANAAELDRQAPDPNGTLVRARSM